MKKLFSISFLPKSVYTLLVLSVLTACGGNAPDSLTNRSATNSSVNDVIPSSANDVIPELSSNPSGNMEVNLVPSLHPVFGVAELSDGKNSLVASQTELANNAAELAAFNKNAAEQATVSGFIVKYKDATSGFGVRGLGGKTLVTASGISNGGLTANAMASALGKVSASMGVSLRVKANAVGNATALATNKMLTLDKAHQIATAMKASDSNIEYIEPDIRMKKTSLPTDSYFTAGSLWALNTGTYSANVENAWDISTGQDVVVAVVDTGITPHIDLIANTLPGADTISTPWIANDSINQSVYSDVTTRDNDATDPGDYNNAPPYYCYDATSSWHGSHVAGTIAAANNGDGVVGVAYNAKILPVRVLGRCGGDLSDVAAGIVWAAGGHVDGVTDNPSANIARVINLSLGGYSRTCSATLKYAIDFARSQGAVVVVAAGNENMNAQFATPANCPNAITVGSTGISGARSYFSNYGALVDIAAPGEGIWSSVDQNGTTASVSATGYANYQGTSMATPHVAGVLALMFSKNPNLTVQQAEVLLKLHSSAFASASTMALLGPGIVNATAILTAQDNSEATATMPSRGNFNADTKSDLLWRNQAGNFTQMSLMGSGTMTTSNLNINSGLFTPNAADIALSINDFDGDDKSDIAWRRPVGNTSHYVFLTHMNGTAHAATTFVPKVIPNGYPLVSTADFGKLKTLDSSSGYINNKADLYFRENAKGQGFFCIFTSTLSQAMSCTTNFTLAAGLTLLSSTDFNNDGYTDMLFRNANTGALYIVYHTNRVSIMAAIGSMPVSETWQGVGDYDGDGKADILFRNSSTSLLSVASNPDSQALNIATSTTGIASHRSILKAGDYTGDGKDDIVIRDNYTGAVSLLEMTFLSDQINISPAVKLGTVTSFFSSIN